MQCYPSTNNYEQERRNKAVSKMLEKFLIVIKTLGRAVRDVVKEVFNI